MIPEAGFKRSCFSAMVSRSTVRIPLVSVNTFIRIWYGTGTVWVEFPSNVLRTTRASLTGFLREYILTILLRSNANDFCNRFHRVGSKVVRAGSKIIRMVLIIRNQPKVYALVYRLKMTQALAPNASDIWLHREFDTAWKHTSLDPLQSHAGWAANRRLAERIPPSTFHGISALFLCSTGWSIFSSLCYGQYCAISVECPTVGVYFSQYITLHSPLYQKPLKYRFR